MGCVASKPHAHNPNVPLDIAPIPIKSAVAGAAAAPSSSANLKANASEGAKYLSVGQSLMSRDQFQSKFTKEWMFKWRNATVVEVQKEPYKIKIHYDGWSEAFDIWVDIASDIGSIAPIAMLSKEDCDKGVALSDEAIQRVQEFAGVRPQHHSKEGSPPKDLLQQPSPPPAPSPPRSPRARTAEKEKSSKSRGAHDPVDIVCPVGTMLDVLDIFYKGGSDQPQRKWRKAKVVESHGTKIRVNFIGWDSKFDEDLDLACDSSRVCEFGTRSIEQTSKAVALQRSPPSERRPSNRPSLLASPLSASFPATPTSAERGQAINAQMADYLSAAATSGLQKVPQSPWRGGKESIRAAKAQAQNADSEDDASRGSSAPVARRESEASVALSSADEREGTDTHISARRRSTSSTDAMEQSSGRAPPGPSNPQPAVAPAPAAAATAAAAAAATVTAAPVATLPVKPEPVATGDPQRSSGIAALLLNPFKASPRAGSGSRKEPADPPAASQEEPGLESTASTLYLNSIVKSRAVLKKIMQLVRTRSWTAGAVDVSAGGACRGDRPTTGGPQCTASEKKDAQTLEDEQVEELLTQTAEKMKEEIEREKRFIEQLGARALHVIEVEGDGNCLFRAVSHQLFLNEDYHEQLRRQCVDHLVKYKDRFAVFVADNFDEYITQMRQLGTWGDDLEIRALEEIVDRNIRIYASDAADPTTPINNNFDEEAVLKGVMPLTISYHGSNHYNSIYDESAPLPLKMRNTSTLLTARMKTVDQRHVYFHNSPQGYPRQSPSYGGVPMGYMSPPYGAPRMRPYPIQMSPPPHYPPVYGYPASPMPMSPVSPPQAMPRYTVQQPGSQRAAVSPRMY